MERTNGSSESIQSKWDTDYRCPSCDIALKSDEVQSHCELEVVRLLGRQKSNVMNSSIPKDENHDLKSDANPCPWGIFQKVRKNRQSRSETKSRKRSPTETKCPICSMEITRDINGHVENCVKSNNKRSDTISEEPTLNNEEFEEYEWAGQKRIRVSSLLQGGYASLGIGTNINNKEIDEDEDLNVDEDDSKVYGPPQYNESDIIVYDCMKKENATESYINNYLRHFITEKNCSTSQEEKSNNTVRLTGTEYYEHEELSYLNQNSSKCAQQIIDSLKSKLRQWEDRTQNKFKCLICLDEYHNPAISVSCWHVHCEECWLRSLGARKLCPQCSLITSAADLRRIYM